MKKFDKNLAKSFLGGVIMDVVNAEQAEIAQEAGAVAVMALERVPADIRATGGVARMSDPKLIKEIQKTVDIPVLAKVRIGHLAEAAILQELGVDMADESEVLSPADHTYHLDKNSYDIPFVCGCRNLGEALSRISEGAAMMRTKGEAGTGDISQAVDHLRALTSDIRKIQALRPDELYSKAKELAVPHNLLAEVARTGKLPVVCFSAGGVATPADAALMMLLGAEGVFVGSGIFKSGNPLKRAKAIVEAVKNYQDAAILAKVSEDLGEAMVGINCDELTTLYAGR